ncbi:Lrp/AsnC ligand binding domain-containing protein [Sphingosinicella rhizophila]|uniref:Lrp/AsnC ligand binding domain-containing protein n=1 Tax=Sphingosinicella rhizophila TaxID=3050082 RepID=A0ABU3Q3W6_9SPHN|nr:Lrp/AsnC ligand binding domain-containing protein [Sphingosinicella sp. GR2756]MDT9598091.1 Lrp/AsnC ligand binding domain-containing protein [Sphingosinicella sp. GR2756]
MMDELDRKILRILQEEGRITNQELATRCAMSPSACLDRMRRLKERGFIRGYAALLDPVLLNQSFLVFVEVVLERTTGDIFRQFSDSVRMRPEIMECHMVAGGFDYLLKLRMPDMIAYRRFLVEVLAEIPGVRETRTYAVMDEVKSSFALPI